jgi:chromosome segregation ATPase
MEAAEKLAEEQEHATADVTKFMAEEYAKQSKLSAEAAKEAADHSLRMAQVQIAAEREANAALLAQGKITAQEKIQADKDAEQQEYAAERNALNAELSALDQHDAAYLNKQKALYNKLEEAQMKHNQAIKKLDDQAYQQQTGALQTWINQTESRYNGEFAKVIMGKQSFARAMQTMDTQIAEQSLQSAMKAAESLFTVQGRKRFNDARTAAADAFASAGNPIIGSVMAAATFAEVMQLNKGGIVPGVELGDTVPAMLTPGEAVIPRELTEHLTNAARHGGGESGTTVNVAHHFSPQIHAIDGASVRGMLNKHSNEFEKHFHNTVRKMNR